MNRISADALHTAVRKAPPGVALAIGVALVAVGVGFIIYGLRRKKLDDNQWDEIRKPWWYNLLGGIVITVIGIATAIYNLVAIIAGS